MGLMGFFDKKDSYVFVYEKNGVKSQIIIKAKDENEAKDKFNKKIGFAQNIKITKQSQE